MVSHSPNSKHRERNRHQMFYLNLVRQGENERGERSGEWREGEKELREINP